VAGAVAVVAGAVACAALVAAAVAGIVVPVAAGAVAAVPGPGGALAGGGTGGGGGAGVITGGCLQLIYPLPGVACPAVGRDAARVQLAGEAVRRRVVRERPDEQAVRRGIGRPPVQQGGGAPPELTIGEDQTRPVGPGRHLHPDAARIGLGRGLARTGRPARRDLSGLGGDAARGPRGLAADRRRDILDRGRHLVAILVLQRVHRGGDDAEVGGRRAR